MHNQSNFFGWQERALGWLLGWGAANTVLCAGAARAGDETLKHVARQAAGWGLVNLALAVNGRRSARRQARTATREQVAASIQRFRLILAVNAVLDIYYILGGTLLVRSAGANSRRKGTGFGIILQGLFLGCYDALLLAGAAPHVEPPGMPGSGPG